MNADGRGSLDSLTESVLGAAFEVANTLGAGFLEKVYERALLTELRLRGIPAVSQASLSVIYKNCGVGDYFADILVQDALVIELKCVDRLTNEHMAQCLEEFARRLAEAPEEEIDEETAARILAAETERGETISHGELKRQLGP